MDVQCMICGKKIELNKMDKNFADAKAGKKILMVCKMCEVKTTYEAKKTVETIK